MTTAAFNKAEASHQSAASALDKLREQGVDVVRVNYPDVHGVARGKDFPLAVFPHVLADGFAVCAANLADGLNHSLANLEERTAASPQSATDGNAPSAAVVFPDMRIRPLASTLVQTPWELSTAWCLASVDPADPQSTCCTRNLLERAVAQFQAIGLSPICAPELEFYLLRRNAQGHLHRYTDDLSMVYTVGARSDPEGVALEMLRSGREIGLDVIAAHHECGRGQYEINLNHGEALHAADRCFRFKTMVKEIAARRGLLATFMGKPFADDAGSGFHLHLSLNDKSGNRLCDPHSRDGLSALARQFLAGILEHGAALTALFSPTVNSYKRFVPGTLVPVSVNWGYDNRTTLLRVPNERGAATRLEFRAADAAANPYLVIAAALFAGLDGIQRKLEPPAPVAGDASKKGALGTPVPQSLDAALLALQADARMVEAIGKPMIEAFCAAKAVEAERYRMHVSEWELNEYAWHL